MMENCSSVCFVEEAKLSECRNAAVHCVPTLP